MTKRQFTINLLLALVLAFASTFGLFRAASTMSDFAPKAYFAADFLFLSAAILFTATLGATIGFFFGYATTVASIGCVLLSSLMIFSYLTDPGTSSLAFPTVAFLTILCAILALHAEHKRR